MPAYDDGTEAAEDSLANKPCEQFVQAAIDWPGISPENTCGSHTWLTGNIVNRTCTVTYDGSADVPNVYRMFLGGAPFIIPDASEVKITGYTGITDECGIVLDVFWDQVEDGSG